MPLYLFRCLACNSAFEIQLKISETLSRCPACDSMNSEFQKLPTAFATSAGLGFRKESKSNKKKENKECKDHSKHAHQGGCNGSYIDQMVKRYEKTLK